MSTSGTTFTDWEQVEPDRRKPLFVEDFIWSEPPSRRRCSTASETRPTRRRRVAADYEAESGSPASRPQSEAQSGSPAIRPEYEGESRYAGEPPHLVLNAREDEPRRAAEPSSQPHSPYAIETSFDLDPIDVEREVDTGWGGRLSATAADTREVVPYSFTDEASAEPSGRRTVVITGRGAGHYSTSRRHAEAGLAFHERAGFNPDRMAMWAVLLGIALMLGCIAH